MTNPFDVIEKVKDLIQDNITDVNSSRRAKEGKWVHTDWPRLDAQSPRVAVFLVSAPSEGVGIGYHERRQTMRFQVSVFVRGINNYQHPDEPDKLCNAEKIANWLCNEIVELINGNNELEDINAKMPRFVDEARNDVEDMLQRSMDFECWIRRGSTNDTTNNETS